MDIKRYILAAVLLGILAVPIVTYGAKADPQGDPCEADDDCADSALYWCVKDKCQCRFGVLTSDWSSVSGDPKLGKKGDTVCAIVRSFVPVNDDNVVGGLAGFAKFIANMLTALVVLAAVPVIVWGGYLYMTAGGSAERVGEAKKWILAALLGIVLALTAYVVLNIVSPSLV